MSLAPDDPRHGTYTGYNNHHCRCEACRAAAHRRYVETNGRERNKEWRHRTGRNRPREVYVAEIAAQHGTESKYSRGCRCDECRVAANTARNERRRRMVAA